MTKSAVGPDEVEHLASPDRFGHSWNIFKEILPVREMQFLRWTVGLDRAEWRGKTFLDVGCGIGRNSYWPFIYAAKSGLSIGVIHHLKNPVGAVLEMVKAIKPGGKLLIWLYGYKNNEWLTRSLCVG